MMPIGPELRQHNLLLLAERLKWPDGAVEVCQEIEAEFPGWLTHWCGGSTKPHGWYSRHHGHKAREGHEFGATPDELREKIRGHRCPE